MTRAATPLGRVACATIVEQCATSAIQAGSEQAERMYDELVDLMYKHSR